MGITVKGKLRPTGKVRAGTLNRPPVWITPAGLLGSVNETESYTKALVAVDPNGDPLTYEVIAGSLPAGLALTAAGTISGTAAGVTQDASATFTVRVSDPKGLFADRAFSLVVLNVNASPVWTTAAGTLGSVLEKDTASFAVQASDPDGTVASYGVQAGSLDTLALNSGSGAITGRAPLVAGTALTSSLSFTVRATDNQGATADRAFDITVRASDPFLDKTAVLLDFEGANRSQRINDRSQMGKARMAGGGTPVLTTAQAKFGTRSVYTGQSAGTYLQYADPAGDLNFAASDFTIEFWAYVVSIPTTGQSSAVLTRRSSPSNFTNFFVGFFQGALRFYASSNGTSWDVANFLDASGTVTLGKWTHFAVVRQGSTYRTFMDGVQKATFTSSASLVSVASSFTLGGEAGTTSATSAYFQDFRIYRSAKYTANFAVPTGLQPNNDNDPFWDSCVFAGQFTDDMADKKGRRIGVAGTATISTAQARSGSSSLYFDGSLNSYVGVALHPAFDFRATDFTMEGWIRPDTFGGNGTVAKFLFDSRTANTVIGPLALVQWDDGKLGIYAASGTSSYDIVNNGNIATLTANQWQHVAVVRFGTYLRVYLNGTKVHETVTSAALATNTFGLSLGGLPTNTNASGYKGFMDGFRVTGYARYTADFTPRVGHPQEEAVYDPYWANVGARFRFDATNGSYSWTDDAKPSRSMSRVYNANAVYVTTAQSVFGGSSLAFGQGGIGYLIDAADDDNLDFGAGDFTIEAWVMLSGTPQGTTNWNNCIMAKWWGNYQGTPQNSWYIGYTSTNLDFEFYTTANTNTNSQSLGITHPGLNRWFHLAIVRYGASIYTYIDGVRQTAVLNVGAGATMKNSTAPLSIGGYTSWSNTTPSNYGSQGYIDDIRITKGIARHTGPAFRLPVNPYSLVA